MTLSIIVLISGDHYIHIKIDIPKELDHKQKAILQAYAEMEDTDGLVADIKEVFDETQEEKPKEELDANEAKK